MIGHPNARHLLGGDASLAQHLPSHVELRLPNVVGVVFDPTRLWIVLWERLAGLSHDLTALIEYNRARAARPLIESKNICCGHQNLRGSLRNVA